mmetsp:Transcript_44380/g.132808  ORF Transcript_44380/g.132808 Transcript_44380/m.132808 type:complete len:285 (+) Transcript_44380:318-1172(+)
MDAAADACDALLQLTHDEFKQPAVRPPPPVQPPRAPQRRLHPGQPPRRLVVLQDLRQLVNQPHRHADGVVLQGQLLLPLNFDAILDNDRHAPGQDRHLHAPTPAPAGGRQAELGMCEVVGVRPGGMPRADQPPGEVVEHVVHQLTRAKAVKRVAPGVAELVLAASVQVDLAGVVHRNVAFSVVRRGHRLGVTPYKAHALVHRWRHDDVLAGMEARQRGVSCLFIAQIVVQGAHAGGHPQVTLGPPLFQQIAPRHVVELHFAKVQQHNAVFGCAAGVTPASVKRV